MIEFDPPYEITIKACDGRDGAHVILRLHDAGRVGDEDKLIEAATEAFQEQFGHPPERVGLAVLPWTEDEDEDDPV